MKSLAILLAVASVSVQAHPILLAPSPGSVINSNNPVVPGPLPPVPMTTVLQPLKISPTASRDREDWLDKCVGDGVYKDVYQPDIKRAYCRGALAQQQRDRLQKEQQAYREGLGQ